jgi:hypothetical protein
MCLSLRSLEAIARFLNLQLQRLGYYVLMYRKNYFYSKNVVFPWFFKQLLRSFCAEKF